MGLSVCLSVCLSVQHLTPRASFRPKNHITYSTGSEGQNNCVNFSETSPLQIYIASCIVWLSVQSAILETAHAHFSVYYTWCGEKRPFLLGRRSEFCKLLLDMPPSKVCPECDTVVPIKLKVCKSCQHVFRAKRRKQVITGKR